MYSLNSNGGIIRNEDNAFIPPDPLNIDYQKYMVWVSEGNTAQVVNPTVTPLSPQDQIDAIERETMVPRVVRESLLAFAQLLAQQQAAALTSAGQATSADQLLAKNLAYMRVKAIDDQIAQLRLQIPSTSTTIATT